LYCSRDYTTKGENGTLSIRQIQEGDIEYVRANPLEEAVKSYPDMQVDPKTSYTALWDGVIVGVGGASLMWGGVYEFWLILTKDSNRNGTHSIVAFEAIKKKIDEIIKENEIFRAQAVVRLDFPKGIKMLEALGFQREGLLRRYTPDGASVYRYSRIR
jgi:hypothetical protein